MKISERVVQELARRFAKEGRRPRATAVCACRCGQPIKRYVFKPGQDAKLRSYYVGRRRVLAAEQS